MPQKGIMADVLSFPLVGDYQECIRYLKVLWRPYVFLCFFSLTDEMLGWCLIEGELFTRDPLSSQLKFWWKCKGTFYKSLFSVFGGSLQSHCFTLCEKALKTDKPQCDLKCTLLVSLHLEPIMDFFDSFIDFQAFCSFLLCFCLHICHEIFFHPKWLLTSLMFCWISYFCPT